MAVTAREPRASVSRAAEPVRERRAHVGERHHRDLLEGELGPQRREEAEAEDTPKDTVASSPAQEKATTDWETLNKQWAASAMGSNAE